VQDAQPSSLSVRLAADPASVPAARRFVVDGLASHGLTHLRDVGELVVSELASNAALHASAQFLGITIEPHDVGVRLSVEDDGPVGAACVSPSADLTDVHAPRHPGSTDWTDTATTTGRGLAIVSMLSDDWGVDVTPRGKSVWATLTAADTLHPVRPPKTSRTVTEGPTPSRLPPGWVLVTLSGCPVVLSLQQDQHLDELVRELQLMSAGGDARSREIADEIRDVLISPTHARLTGRRTAQRALAAGQDVVDIEMAMPVEFAPLMRRLHRAVERADELCEENQMLALASPPAIRRLRDWMTDEVVEQVELARAPRPWVDA
jgi:anti-sigma regulatory factor (Ser/Thr protein kinase)